MVAVAVAATILIFETGAAAAAAVAACARFVAAVNVVAGAGEVAAAVEAAAGAARGVALGLCAAPLGILARHGRLRDAIRRDALSAARDAVPRDAPLAARGGLDVANHAWDEEGPRQLSHRNESSRCGTQSF